ncbi:MAG: PaaI family thioesterase [Anaerovoracaceae bacterium]
MKSITEGLTREKLKSEITEVLAAQDTQPERMNARMGIGLIDCSIDETAVIDYSYQAKEADLNPFGGVHGGAIATLFDTCIGLAAVAVTEKYVTTTDMSISYLRALQGKNFRVHVELTHIGHKMVSGIGWIFDRETDELCATGTASYMTLSYHEKGIRV